MSIVALCLMFSQAYAQTTVSGSIASDTTWNLTGSPYVVSGSVTVNAGVTLTLEPGVVVKGSGTGSVLRVQGTLLAAGTEALPVAFTSVKDDSFGGDTNGDGNASVAAPGDWGGIYLDTTATASVLDHAVVRYGGSNWNVSTSIYDSTNVSILSDQVSVTSSVISESAVYGVRVHGSAPTLSGNTLQGNGYGIRLEEGAEPVISGNTFIGNTYQAVVVDASSIGASITGSVMSDNGVNGILVSLGSFSGEATWSAGEVYVLNGLLYINQGGTLTLEPGVVVTGSSSGSVLRVQGTLLAAGTEALPVVFTSVKDDSFGGDTNGDGNASVAAPGDWGGIYLDTTATASVLDHAVVRYGGSNWNVSTSIYDSTNVSILSDQVSVTSSVISESAVYGVRVHGSAPTLSGNTLQGNGYGIRLEEGAEPVISGNTFIGNTYQAVVVDASSIGASITGSVMSDNGVNGILVSLGSFSGEATWSAGEVYVLNGLLYINQGGTLTLEPGVVVTGSSSGSVLRVQGTLLAAGTEALPVVFTSVKDDSFGGDTNGDGNASVAAPGDWGGIYLDTTATASVLDHAVVRYGGSNWNVSTSIYDSTNVSILSDQVSVTSSVISESAVYGVRVHGSAPTLSGNTLQGNGYGIRLEEGAEPVISGNTFIGNTYQAVVVDASSIGASITGSVMSDNGVNGIWLTLAPCWPMRVCRLARCTS